jgi:hypothetical protein
MESRQLAAEQPRGLPLPVPGSRLELQRRALVQGAGSRRHVLWERRLLRVRPLLAVRLLPAVRLLLRAGEVLGVVEVLRVGEVLQAAQVLRRAWLRHVR